MTAPDEAVAEFDLSTRQGAADAAAYVVAHLGDRLVFSRGDGGWLSRLQPTGVSVWLSQGVYALSVTHHGMGHEYQGGGILRIGPDLEPPRRDPRLESLMEMLRRPVRTNSAEEATTDGR